MPLTIPPNLVQRTPIDSPDKISFCGSTIHVKIQDLAQSSRIIEASLSIWIWSGAQNQFLGSPSVILKSSKISTFDNYISFEISEVIKSSLITRGLDLVNYPTLEYFGVSMDTDIRGEGIFYQVASEVKTRLVDGGPIITQVNYDFPTKYATLGWRWAYEQRASGNNGDSPGGSTGFLTPVNILTKEIPKYYNAYIPRYQSARFDYTKTVSTATTSNLIVRENILAPSKFILCNVRDPYVIYYINKLGLWESFTPYGKVVVDQSYEFTNSPRAFRDATTISNATMHASERNGIDVKETYTINTGILMDESSQLVEEILCSPKVYLIKFLGDKISNPSSGEPLTADNTVITADNTVITADATYDLGVMGENTAYYSFIQIPVVGVDKSFTRSTKINDKTRISYTLKFEVANNKINDIR